MSSILGFRSWANILIMEAHPQLGDWISIRDHKKNLMGTIAPRIFVTFLDFKFF